MKYLLVLITVFFTISTASANYITPGTGKKWNLDSLVANSGGAVTFSSGSYIFNTSVRISLTDTLAITNNVLIKFSLDDTLDVFGVLKITPPDSVKITALDTAQKYRGITLEDQSDGSIIKKTILEYGYGIKMLDCNPLIDSCTLRYNIASTAYSSGALNVFRSNPIISNCKIYRNQRAAVVGGANIANSPQILNNLIYENDTENGNYPQINLGSSDPSTSVVIRGNTITGLYVMSGGISFLPTGSAPNIIIENNIIKKNRYGIAIQGGSINAYINNNTIDSNNIQGLPNSGGSGINFNGTATQICIATRNKIRGNLWGITIQGTAKPNLGNISNTDTTDIGLNQIYNNFNTGQQYDLYNNTPDSIKAENNYWGTTIVDSAEAHIFHKPDNAALGFVDYLPIRLATGVSEITTETPLNYALYNAYPNPFNPSANIKFAIPSSANVKLVIYDNLGRKAAVLVNEKMNAGVYNYAWNASSFASGIYYYSLETQDFRSVKKLVLVK